jgi:anti-anti-sigma regulatory factor
MTRLDISVSEADADTAIVTVCGAADSTSAAELDQGLRRAEELERPGLVVDLSELREETDAVLGTLAECQRRCFEHGRWLLVVPPTNVLTDFLERLL